MPAHVKSPAVELRPVDRTNFQAMLELKLRPEQERFVASPAKSIAASYVHEFGDNYQSSPMVIFHSGQAVGYVTTTCDPNTDDEFWIDDIMIDSAHQRRGYGRAALTAALRQMLASYPRCKVARLTCFRDNSVAQALYRQIGFRETTLLNPVNREPIWELRGAALDTFRPR